MAHSEMYPDGTKIHKFFEGSNEQMAKKFGELSQQAFEKGATLVEQKLVFDNDPCPCGSDIRFDLCCKKKIKKLL